MKYVLISFFKRINSAILSLAFFIIPFFNLLEVNAEVITTYTINGNGVRFREGPSTVTTEIPYSGFSFPYGANLTYLGSVAAGDGCSDPWFNVSYVHEGNTHTGYVCSTFVSVSSYDNGNRVPVTEYEHYLYDKGFPASYWDGLIALHNTHPNWEFRAFHTGLDWNSVITAESDLPSSIYSAYSRVDGRPTGGNVGYRSTDPRVYNWATDTWIAIESGVWYAANAQTVAYYMDPRNFFSTDRIFMFETLSYEESYQTENVVRAILPAGDYYNLDDYASSFITAGDTYDVSPVHLASRVNLEGAYNTKSAHGQQVSCTSDVLVSNKFYGPGYWYSGIGYYNLFNINATGNDVNCTAVAWASNGYQASTGLYLGDGSYGRPWNTIHKSIMGGAQFLAEKYIGIGQNTLYSQKFDIIGPYYFNHQYMTNIQAPYSEGRKSYLGYVSANYISTINDQSVFAFDIPVYNYMPEATSLPVNANPNSYLKSLKIDGTNITGFSYDKTSYNYVVSTLTNSLKIEATPINSGATINGVGNITLPNLVNEINVIATAANGNQTTYKINVTKSDQMPISIPSVISNMRLKLVNNYVSGIAIGTNVSTLVSDAGNTSPLVSTVIKDNNGNVVTNGAIATGYTITINNTIDSNTYTITLLGDTNGDSAVSIKDLLLVQKHLLKSSTLNNAYYQGADVDKDGSVTIKDLLFIQKHLLGISSITQ